MSVNKHEHIYKKDDTAPSTKEIKFRRKLYPDVSVIEERRVQCTVCLKDIKHVILYKRKVYIHKHLNVLLCKDCSCFYGDGEYSVDEDGLDKYCRWCGQGGQLYMCSKCPCAFCKKCIKQNLARGAISDLEEDDWKCYMCQNEPLRELRALCWAVEQHVTNLKNKKRLSPVKKTDHNKKNVLNISAADKEELYSQLNDSSETWQLLHKAKNWVISLDNDLNTFSVSLKTRIDSSVCLNEKAVTKTASEIDKCLESRLRILAESKQTLDDFTNSLINYINSWQKQLQDNINSSLENRENIPEVIDIDIDDESTQEFPDSKNKSNSNNITSDDEQNGIKKNSPFNQFNKNSDKTNNVLDSPDKTDTNKEKLDCDNNKEIEIVSQKKNCESIPNDGPPKPLLRIKNVDELNGIIKPEINNKIESGNKIVSLKPEETNNKTTKGKVNSNKTLQSSLLLDKRKNGSIAKTESKTKKYTNRISESSDMEEEDNEIQKNVISTQSSQKKVEESSSSDSSSISLFSSNSSEDLKSKKKKTKKKMNNSEDSSGSSLELPSKRVETRKLNKKTSPLQCLLQEQTSDSESNTETVKNVDQKKKEKDKQKNEVKGKESENEKGSDDAPGFFESSSDDFEKLLDLKSLKKKRKRGSTSGSSNNSGSETSKTLGKSKKKSKASDKGLSLLDCLGGSDDSTEGSLNIDLENELQLPSLKMNLCSFSLGKGLLSTMSHSEDENDNLSETIDLSDNEETKEKTSKGKKKSDIKENKTARSRMKYDKLLSMKLTETDSSEAEEKWRKHKMKEAAAKKGSEEDGKKQKKKSKRAPRLFTSDSSDDNSNNDKTDSANCNKSDDSDEEKTPPPKSKKRRRIKAQSSDASSNDDEDESKITDSTGKGRKNIRKVLKEENLKQSTQNALKEEQERKKRIIDKQKLYNTFINKETEKEVVELDEVVLDFDAKTKDKLLALDQNLVKKLKPHQADGIKFMWDACFESLEDTKNKKGSGCILAHCMGLGKSLQVVSLLHTLLSNSSSTGVNTALVICPVSTVLNWVNEFEKWLKDVGSGEDIEVYHMAKTQTSYRVYQLKDWKKSGGVMILGYNLYRILVNEKQKLKPSVKAAYRETLVDPGPDIVVCDEGHLLKNENTAISVAMNKIKTRRRIVLTGTPLQNNLVEYHCMVQFVKPNLLGTKKEFKNRFVHPIQNGQFEDSTSHDVKLMKRRAHVLHTMLDGIVQRKDYNVLTPYLPPKYEYVIHLKMSELQCNLYRHYLDNEAQRKLFVDFQSLMRICIHPQALLLKSEKDLLKQEEDDDSEGSLKDFIDDKSDSEASSSSSSLATTISSKSESSKKERVVKRRTRASGAVVEIEEAPLKRSEWWSEIVKEEQFDDVRQGSKIFLFFVILKYCEEIGDKLLVFSQSLYTLDVIELFLNKIDEDSQKSERDPGLAEFSGSWAKGLDYFRLDGASSFDCRNAWCKAFNSERNTRARLFLISTRAGGLGINLTGANRVIIFDASWNPSFDVQSLFRVYRFGQTKPCYIYRFLSKGTMEEKIYERQVAKLSTALRVIDEHQIDRHFSHSALAELYNFDPEASELQDTPVLPKDRLMAELLQSHKDIILSYHQHDSLLENQEDEELTEEERKAAWAEFENEKQPKPTFSSLLYLPDVEERLKIQLPNATPEEIKAKALEIYQNYQILQTQKFQQQLMQQQMFQQQSTSFQQQQQTPFQQIYQNMPYPRFNTPSVSNAVFNKDTYKPYSFPQGILQSALGQQKSNENNSKFVVNPKAAAASSSNTPGFHRITKPSDSALNNIKF